MDKKKIVESLEYIVHDTSKKLSNEEKISLAEAIKLLERSSKKEDFLKVVDILIKLLGIASNFFEK